MFWIIKNFDFNRNVRSVSNFISVRIYNDDKGYLLNIKCDKGYLLNI